MAVGPCAAGALTHWLLEPEALFGEPQLSDQPTPVDQADRIHRAADELFASTNTLAAIEDHLFNVAHTLAHLPPVVRLRPPQVEWAGWDAVHRALRDQAPERRDVVWYGACSLLPATLVLLDQLRAQVPDWFAIHY